MGNWIIPVGAVALMIIFYALGPVSLFCSVGCLIAGSLIEKGIL